MTHAQVMGTIKEGFASGLLPVKDVFAIHYPAYTSLVDHAIESLGGSDGILKARHLGSIKLELHFRPKDPYSHPAFGEVQPCNNFLLKISKKKVKDDQGAQNKNRVSENSLVSNEKSICSPKLLETASQADIMLTAASTNDEAHIPCKAQEVLSAEVIARVSEAYHFNGMVDYQHVLPVHADVTQRKKRNWADLEPKFERSGIIDVDQEDLMILVPPLFSLKDVPDKVVLKPCVDVSSKKKQGVVQNHWEMGIEPCLAIDFNIKEVPTKVNWEKYIPQDSEQWEWQVAVSKFFDERPIWCKDSLVELLSEKGLQFGGNMLRRLLFRTAYYFSNGPFLRFWIRKGYDPRKDSESRLYQRIDFRVPPSLRSYCDSNLPSRSKHRWEDICTFRVFPCKCQVSLQLFELADEYIQQEIKRPPSQATCSFATGWFSSWEIDSLRLCVAVRFLSLYPLAGGDSLLKSTVVRFEKSKRARIYAKEPRLDGGGQQRIQEVMGNDERVINYDEDEDEDEFEDDNVEEEMDAYEAFDIAGADGNFYDEPSSCILPDSFTFKSNCNVGSNDTDPGNISRKYLQELFGSFPISGEVGIHSQNIDVDDGEYQIYEQCSDDKYSDDNEY